MTGHSDTDHLTAVRAALDLAGKATPGEWWQGAVERHHVFAERGNPSLIAPEAGRVLLRMSEHFPAYAHDAAAIVALRNAAPAIAALADECAAARDRIATLEAELAQARAHRCGGIVLSAEDADRIAALLEDPPAPTPAMVALFAKAKE